MPAGDSKTISVVIPCHNEEGAIGKVVSDFRRALPNADIFVIDNCSTDNTPGEARNAGAEILTEPKRGKGHAVRRGFSSVNSDIIVMVDGDGTYDASAAPSLIDLLIDEKLEMVVGARQQAVGSHPYRWGHGFGNRLLSWIIRPLFGIQISDSFSGYRAFTKRFIKNFPAKSRGFEIETELNVYAISLGLNTKELPTYYFDRLGNTQSKLRTFRDGFLILVTLINFCRIIRPMRFFGLISIFLALVSGLLFLSTFSSVVEERYVEISALNLVSLVIFLCALGIFFWCKIADISTRRQLKNKRTAYHGNR